MILTFFNFHLSLPTTCHFTEMLLPYSILLTDCQDGKAKDYQCVKYFLDVTLQEVFCLWTYTEILLGSFRRKKLKVEEREDHELEGQEGVEL